MPLKERKRVDLSAASTTALAGSQLGSPDRSSLRTPSIQNISGLSSSNEECSSSLPPNCHTNSDSIAETRRCSSLEGMLNKDDTPALPNQKIEPKHTSTPIPSPNNDSTGYITMVPVKFDTDKHTRYFLNQIATQSYCCFKLGIHLRWKGNIKKVITVASSMYNTINPPF